MKTQNKMPRYTSWAEATTNPFTAVRELLRCQKAGYNAWIELMENGDQYYPIRIENPKLRREESWKPVDTRTTTRRLILEDVYFFNDTARKLTLRDNNNYADDEPGEFRFYKPKGGIPNTVTKPLKRKVFVVCFNTRQPAPVLWTRVVLVIISGWKFRKVALE